MSEEQSSASEVSPDEPAASPTTLGADQVADIQRSFLRLTFWQTLLSLAGVFTGAVALYAALNESQAVREQTSASVWPYVQFMINDRDVEDSAHFALSFDNVGVGPALMQGMRLSLNGVAQRDWETVTRTLLGNDAELGADYGKSDVSRRVLAPGESVVVFQTEDPALVRGMQEAIYNGAALLSYCYCSIFNQCWSFDSKTKGDQDALKTIEACPDHGDEAFLD